MGGSQHIEKELIAFQMMMMMMMDLDFALSVDCNNLGTRIRCYLRNETSGGEAIQFYS
jgi:hypothetical protein